jgi:hypothetical protein
MCAAEVGNARMVPTWVPTSEIAERGNATRASGAPCPPARRPLGAHAEFVGQRDLTVTANTYSHVLVDEAELDYAELLNRRRASAP